MLPHSIDDFLYALMRGEAETWPTVFKGKEKEVLERVDFHGIGGLLWHRILSKSDSIDWPGTIISNLRSSSRALVMWELAHKHFIETALQLFDEAGVRPILFKGTAMAYSIYAEPFLRSRGDTDLLVPHEKLSQVLEIFRARKFQYFQEPGDLVFRQGSILQPPDKSSDHIIDLHTRFNNSPLLADLFTYEELLERSINLPDLHSSAIGADPESQLIITCVHRAVHLLAPYNVNDKAYFSADRVIWIEDIKLLMENLDSEQWERFINLAQEKNVANLCREGLQDANRMLGAVLPDGVQKELANAVKSKVEVYLESGNWTRYWMNLMALESFMDRLGFLQQTFFPPANSLRKKYKDALITWLPWLYFRRILGGLLGRVLNQIRRK